MQTMLSDAVKHGFAGEPVLGFAKVDLRNPEEVRAAIAIFGGVLFGLDLQVAQQDQLDEGVWDYARSGEWGGHAIMAGAYDTSVETGVTWAKTIRMTNQFIRRQLAEAWVVILPAHLGTRRFLEGMDMATFAADYEQLTGRPFPSPATPTPVPAPPQPSPTPSPGSGGASFRLDLDPALALRLVAKASRAGVSPEQWLHTHVAAELTR
jgi:hypothetical protein